MTNQPTNQRPQRPITRIIAAHRLLRDSPLRELHGVQVPDEVLHDDALNEAISVLPANYNFEVIPMDTHTPTTFGLAC